MANAVYPKYLIALLDSAAGPLSTSNIKCILVDAADYVYSAAHEFLTDVPGAAIVATSPNMTGKTLGVVGAGVFDCDNFVFTNVTGDGSEILIFYEDTAVAATSRLISFHDGFTVTPVGTNINVTVPVGGVFSI